MLKKAGIVVATATAGLLAVSPLAFAGGTGGGGILSIDDNAIQIPIQACNNNVINNVVFGFLAKNQKATSSNKGNCKQRNSADRRNSNSSRGHGDRD